MARYNTTVTSAAALPTTTPTGSTAGALFGLISVSNASGGSFKLRRVTLGVVAGTGAPTSQQCVVALVRTTNPGTITGPLTPGKLDPTVAASNCTVGAAWSVVPTVASWAAPYVFQVAFNTQSGVDLPWELLEELAVQGYQSGLAFINSISTNALPSGHSYVMAAEWEE
jgi:hypothetical protein